MPQLYADIILPLPLNSSFTYAVPESISEQIKIGCRVLVQFGRVKIYTGIVESLHFNKPSEFDPKDIIAPLDSAPIIRYPQLKFWQWISDYYLCSKGEIFKAALPSALKIESESWIEITDLSEKDELEQMGDKHMQLYIYLQHAKKARISDLEKNLDIGNVRYLVNALLEMGVVRISEKLVDKYVSKTETFVTLNCARLDSDALHRFFELTSRSHRQQQLIVAFLDLSKWLVESEAVQPVTRSALLEKSGATPAILKALVDKGIINVSKSRINRFYNPASFSSVCMPELSAAQENAIKELRRQMSKNLVTLLHGVTGSGKTEIYAHMIKTALDHGDQVLFLVPEISLTTQLTSRLQKIFGDKLIVYHSKFSDSERVDIWRRLLMDSEPRVILGVRSSIFLPFARIGLVIVDEEHEASYKQYDPAPRYNARDAGIVLAQMHGAKVILGSATPSVETYFKAQTGKYGLVTLSERFGNVKLPEVKIVDMSDQRKRKSCRGAFSAPLLQAIERTTASGNQSIIFQNRRGYAPVVICSQCGWTPKCENCDVTLVYHKHINELRCHYCGYTRTLPKICPACGENSLQVYGYGTERIAEDLHSIHPELRISRMDLDTTRNKDGYQEIINEFSSHCTDVLIGTQMVSKGLDFRKVKLVGVVNADTLLNFPDFRSNERAFNMMEQVAGRAGRHGYRGEVIIQTSDPSNAVINDVVNHDYMAYYNREIKQREDFVYPPFSKIINIYLRHKDEKRLIEITMVYVCALREVFGSRILGPETPYVGRISNYHIRTLMLKIESGASMQKVKQLLRRIYENLAAMQGVKQLQLHYDVDPV